MGLIQTEPQDVPVELEPPILAIVEPDPPMPDPVLLELERTNRLLEQLLRQARRPVEKIGLCVMDTPRSDTLAHNFPMRGSQRSIVRRTGAGGLFTVTTTLSLLLPADEARLGGELVNYSPSTGAFVYCTGDTDTLGNPLNLSVPVFWLSPNGGSWDFQLGDMLWCGRVSARAQTGSATLTVAAI